MLVVYGLKVSHPMCFSMRQLLELNIKKNHLSSQAMLKHRQLRNSSCLGAPSFNDESWESSVTRKKPCRGVFERRCRVMKEMTLDPLLKIEVQAHWYKNDTLPPFAACCTQRFLSLANCCSRPFSCAERQSRYFSYAGPDLIVRENQLSACITLHIGIAYLCLLACSPFFCKQKGNGHLFLHSCLGGRAGPKRTNLDDFFVRTLHCETIRSHPKSKAQVSNFQSCFVFVSYFAIQLQN